MSFFKSLYQKLLKGTEQDYEVEIESAPRERERGSNKELDVRVAYEYPKGNFRFPLIPDEAIPRREQRNAVPEKKHKPLDPRRSEHNHKKDERPAKKVRPFTPTDIPSPVYGFAKIKKVEDVEYELSGFMGADTLEPTDPIAAEPVSVIDIPNVDEETSRQDIQTDLLPEPILDKVQGTFQETIQEQYDLPTPSFVHLNEGNEMAVGEKEVLEAGRQVELHISAVEDIHSVSEEPLFHIENGLISEDNGPDSVQVDAIVADVTVEESERDDEILTGALEKIMEGSPEMDELAVVEEPAAEATTASVQKERSHLPFNVLMLKQDKRKLEQKKAWENPPRFNSVQKEAPKVQETSAPEVGLDRDDDYQFPGVELLKPPIKAEGDPAWLEERKRMLDETLFNFNVGAKVVNVTQGPSVTRFEVHPEPGVKVNKVTNLSDDIKLSLAARDIRIEAPIPGKHTIGIEVPNPKSRPVLISEIIGSSPFEESSSPLTAVLGLDISGNPIVTDLKKMPHGLIAGATGSGKSVCINSILVSLLYKASPEDLKLLLIDPKMVELAPYNRIPHLVSPVITDVKAATAALKWAVDEMERRYELFAHAGVRDINRFNELALETKRYSDKLPYLVIIIDELADLMMMSPADVEEAICRIAQKARACGIHLIIATQRPSVDVITGLIKANVPTRIAFSVSSQVDSRTIIDISGAERLLGRGDMLFLENGSSKPVRLQGTFVSDSEIDQVVSFAREQREPDYLFEQEELLKKAQVTEEEDELFYEACEFVIEQGGASTSSLQRRFKVGYNRAARLIDMMEEAGFISGARGSKPRDVLISEADLESFQEASMAHY
ncbi:DNA translocase FtsK [Bacillus sp. B-jedd]|uniref:DNA translocase FtsK n=1 Tax=Bacillus sp. B-jedd TaxID=1476857 RepID=UPI0005156113|nr:DNA translocase FtsK [Bacillus sp. B-jedd]CEG28239.1 cell division FtsK/SpoIIIE [Bacillus sp. B-jedd]